MLHRQTAAFASIALAAAFALPVISLGDQVQLPYQTSDNNGNQWMVYMQGSLQQQGNQPVFQQAAMITVNGQQAMLNNQNANFDSKTNTLTLNFNNRAGTLRQTRQIRFGEIMGAHPRIEFVQPEVDRIRPILNRRLRTLPIPCRC